MNGGTILRAGAAGLLLALASCGSDVAGAAGPPDVLLVSIDTLRQDFVGVYGHGRGPTPELDALASRSVVFDRHYSVMSHTAPAHASIFTGLYPREHGLRKNSTVLDEGLPVLAEDLQRAGYATRGVVAVSFLGEKLGFDRGFDVLDDDFGSEAEEMGQPNLYRREAEDVVDRALDLLDEETTGPLFLWVHLYDPHAPHDPPRKFRVDDDDAEAFYGPRVEPSPLGDADHLVALSARYEGMVRYTDHHVGRLLDAWFDRARSAGSVVAVTADHGEGLGEHRLDGHGLFSYEEQLVVPMLLRLPDDAEAGRRVAAPTSHVDLAATIGALTDVGLRTAGAPLTELLTSTPGGDARQVLAERREFPPHVWGRRKELDRILTSLDGGPGSGRGDQLAVVRGRWKYIWTADSPDELFDLEADPTEWNNLAGEHPDLVAELRRTLETWRDSAEARAPDAVDLTGDAIEADLEALGYLDAEGDGDED